MSVLKIALFFLDMYFNELSRRHRMANGQTSYTSVCVYIYIVRSQKNGAVSKVNKK
jgi:hypothetical protein